MPDTKSPDIISTEEMRLAIGVWRLRRSGMTNKAVARDMSLTPEQTSSLFDLMNQALTDERLRIEGVAYMRPSQFNLETFCLFHHGYDIPSIAFLQGCTEIQAANSLELCRRAMNVEYLNDRRLADHIHPLDQWRRI